MNNLKGEAIINTLKIKRVFSLLTETQERNTYKLRDKVILNTLKIKYVSSLSKHALHKLKKTI